MSVMTEPGREAASPPDERRRVLSVRGRSERPAVPALLVLGLLCFFLPFATAIVGCEENDRVTVSGIDLVTAAGVHAGSMDESDIIDPDVTPEMPEKVGLSEQLVAQVPAATVAFASAATAVLFALLPGATAAAAAMLAAGFSAGALLVLALSGYLRPDSLLLDMRYGYWLALLLIGGALVVARRRWRRLSPGRVEGRATRLGFVGGLLLLAAMFVPGTPLEVAAALSPAARASAFWGAIAALALPFLVLLATRVLPSARAAAPTLAALGAAGALTAAASLLLAATAAYRSWSDGSLLVLAGSALVLAAGVTGARALSPPEQGMRPASRLLAAAGGSLAVVAVFVPYDGGGAGASRALLERDVSASSWLALPPLALALLTLAVAAAGSRRYGDALLGLATGVAFVFLPLLYPLLDNEGGSALAPGAAIGLLGALAIAAGGAVELARGRLAAGEPADPLVRVPAQGPVDDLLRTTRRQS